MQKHIELASTIVQVHGLTADFNYHSMRLRAISQNLTFTVHLLSRHGPK
jgi:hypothetical protein